ncbi:MAG: acetyltransferase [Desulfobulbus sp.]|nr:acetyltransferase [Desulfobulbus sp.]
MVSVDVFNGDADGICALQQLRLQAPEPGARLVTGVKRQITLLNQLKGISNSRITVLDISLESNRDDVLRLLRSNNHIFYIDHHYSGEIPDSPLLTAHIDTSPGRCTSLIVDQLLDGAHRTWAIAGAFGDGLDDVARTLAGTRALSAGQQQILKEIGILLNYNSYGLTPDDLFIQPADLFRAVNRFTDPFRFHADYSGFEVLRQGYAEDMSQASRLKPARNYRGGRIFFLPGAPWARRTVGILASRYSREQPQQAHAVLLPKPDGGFLVSVRAPLANRYGADTLCRQFATGGGRVASAGINELPEQELDRFIEAFIHQFPGI